MGRLRDQMEADLRLRNFRPKTQETYLVPIPEPRTEEPAPPQFSDGRGVGMGTR